MMDSRRKSVRRFARTRCEVVRERGFVRLGTRAIDVSEDGLFLMTDRVAEIGEPVVLTFELNGQYVDAEGHVARAALGRRAGDSAMGLAIAFDAMDAGSRESLRRALAKIPPRVPATHGMYAPHANEKLERRTSLAPTVAHLA